MQAQRAILEVRYGPLRCKKAVLAPGERLRVGRTERASFVIPSDEQLSGAHFELAWDGATLRIADLQSTTGTLVGGAPVTAGVLKNGDWIRAGRTDFMVFLEGATPPPEPDDDDDEEDEEDEDAVLAREAKAREEERRRYWKGQAKIALERAGEPLYAVVDAARDDRILVLAHESVEEYRSLYEGVEGETLEDVAPYLIALPPGSRLLDALIEEGWGKRWGIYLASRLPFRDVRRHLRRFLMVEQDETGDRMYFRFYDPGVLRAILPAFTPMQYGDFFGDVVSVYVAEGDDLSPMRFAARRAPC